MGLAKNSFITFTSQLVAQFLQLALGVMTARLLGPEGKGLIYFLIVSITISVTLASIGLGPASIYYIGKDRKHIQPIFANLLITTALMSLLLACAGFFLLQFFMSSFLSYFPFWVWLLIAIMLPIHLLHGFFMQLMSALLRILEINILEISKLTVQLIFFVIFVVFLDMGTYGAFLAYTLPISFATIIYFALISYHGGRPKSPSWTLLLNCLRYGLKAYLFDILRLLNVRLNALLLMNLASNPTHSIGLYSVATSLAELLLFVPTSIRLSLFPMISAGGRKEADRLTPMASRHTLLLTSILALVVTVTGPFVIPYIYGKAFRAAIIPLILLLPGVLMLSQAVIFYGDLSGRGKPGITSVSTLISLLVTLALSFFLIPQYGINGAALASLGAYSAEYLIAGLFFFHYSGLQRREIFFFRSSDFRYYFRILPYPWKIPGSIK